jgi:flagellar biogenesis protein FliO
MELTQYLIKVVLSLLVVLGIILFLLPLLLRKGLGFRGAPGKGSFEIKKVSPIAKNVFIVELDIKGRTFVLCVSEKGADVIYREDERGSSFPDNPESGSLGSKSGDTPDRGSGG